MDTLFYPFRYRGKVLHKRVLIAWGIEAELIKTDGHLEDRPNLVLIHGMGNSWNFWIGSLKYLEDKFNVHMFAMPWNCYIPCPFGSLEHLNQWLAEIFEQAAIKNPVVLAHSYGASAILSMALNAEKEIFSKQILCSIFWSQHCTEEIRQLQKEAFVKNYQYFIHAGVLASIGERADAEIVQNIYEKALLKVKKEIVFDFGELFYRSGFPSIVWDKIQMPTLIISGSQDSIIPTMDQALVSKKIPNVQCIALDQAGHFPMVERKEFFYARICEFCTG